MRRLYTTNYSIKFSNSLFERGDKEKKSRGERTVILSRRQSKPTEMRGLQDQLFARYHPIRNRSALAEIFVNDRRRTLTPEISIPIEDDGINFFVSG